MYSLVGARSGIVVPVDIAGLELHSRSAKRREEVRSGAVLQRGNSIGGNSEQPGGGFYRSPEEGVAKPGAGEADSRSGVAEFVDTFC